MIIAIGSWIMAFILALTANNGFLAEPVKEEEIIEEQVITETFISEEYLSELEYNSRTNGNH